MLASVLAGQWVAKTLQDERYYPEHDVLHYQAASATVKFMALAYEACVIAF